MIESNKGGLEGRPQDWRNLVRLQRTSKPNS